MSPLTTRRDYGGSILTHLHTGTSITQKCPPFYQHYLSSYIMLCFTVILSCLGNLSDPNYFNVIAVLNAQRQQPKTKQTPWPESTSELYRPSGRRLPAKLAPTFTDREVSRSQRGESPITIISVF
jgi:hypothetical protein